MNALRESSQPFSGTSNFIRMPGMASESFLIEKTLPAAIKNNAPLSRNQKMRGIFLNRNRDEKFAVLQIAGFNRTADRA